MATSGFNFGKAATTGTPATGSGLPGTLSFGVPASTTLQSAVTATPQIGFGNANNTNFGLSAAAPVTPNISFGASAPSTAAPGLTLGQSASTGFSLGATATSTVPKTGLPCTIGTSSTPSFSFAKPIAATTAPSGFGIGTGIKLTTATTTSSTGLGGKGFGLTSTAAATGASIFGQSVAKTASSGLGGVDPKTTTSATASDAGKPGDGKAVKETAVENNIMLDVDELCKFVKEEKSEMEQMKRLSSTPMVKVQEDNAALKQLLSVVSSGLQRNACAVDKLKREMTQELKNAEMAVRTKETPDGLQYENIAPTQYFQCVIENFETQMVTYRQQIEMLENHLASLHQPNRLTHEELILLLRKLHEAFIAMAAQLQQIHESVKTQKEHYLNYRKVFHGDNRNIFERQRKAPVKLTSKTPSDMYGQPPFPGINNTAAVAMASALTRTQQPQAAAGAPPVTGFINFQPTTGFGTASTGFGTGTSGFGTGSSGFGTGTSGFGTGSSGFGTGSSGFGTGTSGFGTGTSGFGTGTGPLPRPQLPTSAEQPFQLGRPPGSKRVHVVD